MRYGTRRPAERRDSFRFDALLLRYQKFSAHFRESYTQFHHFAASFWSNGVSVVSGSKRANTRHQIFERPCDGSRHKAKQNRAHNDGSHSYEINSVIQVAYEAVHRPQWHEHKTPYGRRERAVEQYRRECVLIPSERDVSGSGIC